MNLLITFYNIRDTRLTIANGFSFVRHQLEGQDIFVDDAATTQEIAAGLAALRPQPDHIYCSITLVRQWEAIRPLLDARWVVGGPAVAMLEQRGLVSDLPDGVELCREPFEFWLGGEELSSTFTVYFKRFAAQNHRGRLIYNCSLGFGCRWDRCSFCSYRDYYGERISGLTYRPDLPGILGQLWGVPVGDAMVNLCVSSFTPEALGALLETQVDPSVRLNLFARADRDVVERIERSDRFENSMMFNVGLESFSQGVVDRLNKGIQVADALRLAELVVERGGVISFSLMDHYPFLDATMVEEGLAALEALRELSARFPRKIALSNNGPTRWYRRDAVEEVCEVYADRADGVRRWFEAVVAPDSEAFRHNRTMARAIRDSGIRLTTSDHFVSLEEEVSEGG